MKYFLVKAKIQHGEQQRYSSDVIKARNRAEADKQVETMFPHDDCGFDTRDTYFGVAHESISEHYDTTRITAAEAATIRKLGL